MLTRKSFIQNSALLAASAALARRLPAATVSLPDFKSLTLEQQVGQLVIARLPDWQLIEKYAKEGIITGLTPSLLKFSPAEAAEFTNRFQRLSPIPLLLGWGGTGYKGGTEVRLHQAMRLAATRSVELCREAARIEAVESRAVGIHIAGTPVVDVNSNPDNPIINLRSLGDNVELVIELGTALARGSLDGRAVPDLMHFPGHGASSGDSHIAMPEVNRTLAELDAVDLKPFAELTRRGLGKLVCTNHCYYPAWEPSRRIPATFSRKIITGVLREKLGFDGVAMSDSLTMRAIKDNYGIEEAAIETVAAGHDMILQDYNSDPKITIEALARAVRTGRIPAAQIEKSVRRIWRLKTDLGLFENRLADPDRISDVFATKQSADVARRIARESITALENRGMPLHFASGRNMVIVSNGSASTVERDTQVSHSPGNQRLNGQIRDRVGEAKSIVLSTQMNAEEIERAFAAAKSADVVVCGLFTRVRAYAEDAIRVPEPYRDLIERIAGTGRTLVLLNFGNPYVVADLPRPAVSLCTFSDANDSIDAAVQVLFGELKPRGKLPVSISKSYPFGHGLS